MKKYPVKIFSSKKVQLFFALILFLVVGLHTIHFDHNHQKEIFGDEAQAITHGSDKKHFFVLDAPNLSISSTVFSSRLFIPYFAILFIFLLRRIFDPFREAFSRGIIHPKIYA